MTARSRTYVPARRDEVEAQEAEEFSWFVGIDWGTASHVVNVGDAAGTLHEDRRIAHDGPALQALVGWLHTLSGGQLSRVAVAIEAPRGAVVETLLSAGAAVFTLNPKQVDRFRDRFSVAGAKDDHLDARVLRSALRTDRGCFRRLALEASRVIQVREMTRAAEALTDEFLALTNRLREQVHRIAPDWLRLSANADDPWFWALLQVVQTPERASQMRRAVIARVLRTHRISRVTVDEVLAVLRAPAVYVAPGTVEATTRHIALLLARVRLVHGQRRECARHLESLLDSLAQHPTDDDDTDNDDMETATNDGSNASVPAPIIAVPPRPTDVAILRSLPGVGVGVTAAVIAEAMPLVARRDYATLRATTGVAPVRRQTGKNTRGTVAMRRACNARLRDAVYHWAMTSTRIDAAARAYYAALRSRGHSHGRALRSVADRWLRILIAMLKTQSLYDPTRYAAIPTAPLVA